MTSHLPAVWEAGQHHLIGCIRHTGCNGRGETRGMREPGSAPGLPRQQARLYQADSICCNILTCRNTFARSVLEPTLLRAEPVPELPSHFITVADDKRRHGNDGSLVEGARHAPRLGKGVGAWTRDRSKSRGFRHKLINQECRGAASTRWDTARLRQCNNATGFHRRGTAIPPTSSPW